jgi:hypothetical protein
VRVVGASTGCILPSANTTNTISTAHSEVSSMSLEWYKAFFEIGGVILLFLTFVFGAGALIVSGRINRAQAAELRAFQLKIEGEQQKTAEAQREATEAQRALGQAVASRRLTGEQKVELTKFLKQYSDPVGIVVVSALLDPESSDFADDFDAAIKDAKWKTLRPKDRLTNNTGISLGVAEGTPTLDPWGRPILKLKERMAAALRTIEVP